jgi:cytochrome c-type biogenesis protein CcmE
VTRKQRRLVLVASAVAALGVALGLVLAALRDNIVFFYGPSELAEKAPAPGTRLRIGGLVEEGSLQRGPDQEVRFVVTDTKAQVRVAYRGALPDLFREGQGVVAEGKLGGDGLFWAESVLAKHDERYMPREVADTLKKQGLWQERSKDASPSPKDASPSP